MGKVGYNSLHFKPPCMLSDILKQAGGKQL